MLPSVLMPACCYPSFHAQMAEVLYCIYNRGGPREVAGRNYRGEICPVWSDLPLAVKTKWEHVGLVIHRAGLPEIVCPIDRLWTDAPISGVHGGKWIGVLRLDGDNVIALLRSNEIVTVPSSSLHLYRPTYP